MEPAPIRPGLRRLKRLDAWNVGMDLAVAIYEITRSFPREEVYGLTSQLRRASARIPSVLGEGNERDTVPDRRNFVTTAKGSLSEIETQLELSLRLGFVQPDQLTTIYELADHLSAMLTNLWKNMPPRPR